MKRYRVVRSYKGGSTNKMDLERAFDHGWEFVKASEFVPDDGSNGYGYIEYILAREEEDEKVDYKRVERERV